MSDLSTQTIYIIVNAIDPYGLEVNRFLACPNGTKCVVRYKTKWLPTIKDPGDLIGIQGVLILRDWETARLIPLRRLTISKILPVGEILDIEWVANEMIEYDSDSKKRQKQIDKFEKHLETHFGKYENIPEKDFQNLVFTVAADFTRDFKDSKKIEDEADPNLHHWGKVVDAIGKLAYYADIDFLKVIEIVDTSDEETKIIPKNDHDGKVFKLKTDKKYKLTIYQRAFTDKPRGDSSVTPRNLILSCDDKSIEVYDNSSLVTGKYAGHRFRFKTESTKRKLDTFLRIETKRDDDKKVPPIDIPIQIVLPPWDFTLMVLSIIVFILGTVVLFLADKLFPNNLELARNFSIVAMILTSKDIQDVVSILSKKLGLVLSGQ